MVIKFSRNQKIEIAIVALAIILRVGYFWINMATHDNSLLGTIWKSESYYEIAHNILSGHGFSGATTEPYTPDSWRTPLYPLFIAANFKLFGSDLAVIISQIIMGSILALLAKRISYHIMNNEKIAIGVGIFFAIEPLLIRLTSVLLTETLILTLFFGFLLAFYNYLKNEKFSYLAVSAVLLGLTTLTRPITQYLPVIIVALIIWIFRKKITIRVFWRMIGFLVIFVMMLSPWLYRNSRLFGSPALAATSANNLYGYFIPSILALKNNISYNEAKNKFFAEEKISDLTIIDLKTANHFTQRSIEILKKMPPYDTTKVIVLTVVSLFTQDGYRDILGDLGLDANLPAIPVFKIIQSPRIALSIIGGLIRGPAIIVIAGRIFWILMTLFAALGIIKYLKRERLQNKISFTFLIIFYFTITSAVVGLGVTARYRAPINIFIATFAFYAIGRQENTKLSSLKPIKVESPGLMK